MVDHPYRRPEKFLVIPLVEVEYQLRKVARNNFSFLGLPQWIESWLRCPGAVVTQPADFIAGWRRSRP